MLRYCFASLLLSACVGLTAAPAGEKPRIGFVWCVNNPHGDLILLVAPLDKNGEPPDALSPLWGFVPDNWPWWIPVPTRELWFAAAPVPKQAPPKQLTADMMLGTWHYEWSSHLDGVITFDAEGGYVGVHVPGSSTIYSGTWKLEGGDTVVLSEYTHDLDTNARWGPNEYRFVFKAGDYPKLKGLSNGTTHVAIERAKP